MNKLKTILCWLPALLIIYVLFAVVEQDYVINTMIEENNYKKYTTITYIYSLGDNTNTNGNFYLGFGQVETEWEYSYYYKTKDGFKIGTQKAIDTYIVEDDTIPPQVREVTKCLNKDIEVDFLLSPKRIIKENVCQSYTTKEIVIPKNSIKQNYNLDLN